MLDQASKIELLEIMVSARSFARGSGEELRILEVDRIIESGEIVGPARATPLRIIGDLIAPSAGDAKSRDNQSSA
jgi:hypothetical protein